ncbi:MAG: DUF6000 family protein [Polyangiales bacterium]
MPPSDTPSHEFLERWVVPFYLLDLSRDVEAFIDALRHVAPELNEAVIAELLARLNWRPRIVGAYFVAIRRCYAFEEQIGRLLLRSEVCYAGRGFCVALARLNTPASVASLEEYLDVYLSRVEWFFDQGEAMAALGYLDAQNGTDRRARFMPRWQRFIENKPRWDLTRHDNLFRVTMNALERVATSVA